MKSTTLAAIIAALGLAALVAVFFVARAHMAENLPSPPPPDYVCPGTGAGLYFNGIDAGDPAVLCADVLNVAKAGDAVCPAARTDRLAMNLEDLSLRLEPDPFPCLNSPRGCHGQQDGELLLIGSRAAIPDELGHLVWEACFGRSGEKLTTLPDGGPWTVYDSDFEAWCKPLRAEMK